MRVHLWRAAIAMLALAAPLAAAAQQAAAPAGRARPDIPGNAGGIAQMQARFDAWKAALPATTGPLKVLREEPPTLREHTLFRPAELTGRPLPVVAFANGGCRNTPIEFTAFLAEIASHGYVVIAQGTDDVEFALADFRKVMPDGKPLQRVDTAVLTDAVDWAARENARRGSPYFGRLNLGKVAYMGQSCGGIQALAASADPRTTTTVVLNSAEYGPDLKPVANARLPERITWDQLHAPIAYFIGGPQDSTYQQSKANFAEIRTLPVFDANLPVGHTGAYPQPDPRWTGAVIGWLDWQLKDRRTAARQFVGHDCGLCRDKAWTVKSKNLM